MELLEKLEFTYVLGKDLLPVLRGHVIAFSGRSDFWARRESHPDWNSYQWAFLLVSILLKRQRTGRTAERICKMQFESFCNFLTPLALSEELCKGSKAFLDSFAKLVRNTFPDPKWKRGSGRPNFNGNIALQLLIWIYWCRIHLVVPNERL